MGRIIELKGHTEIWLFRRNGEEKLICDRHNTIGGGIKAGFAEAMHPDTSIPNFAIDDLFDDSEVSDGSTQDGKDGIALTFGTITDCQSMITTSVTPDNTYGKKWRGEVQFSTSHSNVSGARLGHDFGDFGSSLWFDYLFAQQTFSYEEVEVSDRIVVNWEIYL